MAHPQRALACTTARDRTRRALLRQGDGSGRARVSAPSTIIHPVPFKSLKADIRRTLLARALPRSYQVTTGHPHATSDTRKSGAPADSLNESQLAARSGQSRGHLHGIGHHRQAESKHRAECESAISGRRCGSPRWKPCRRSSLQNGRCRWGLRCSLTKCSGRRLTAQGVESQWASPRGRSGCGRGSRTPRHGSTRALRDRGRAARRSGGRRR